MKDIVRRSRSNSATGSVPSNRSSKAASPRMSILPSVKFPLLRRQDPNEPPSNNKSPLLTLHFTSRSFLDSSVEDSVSKELLYQFKTVGTSTTISRADSRTRLVKMASIKWPRSLPTKSGKDYTDGILIQMKNARWYGGETLLKLGGNRNSSRKFSIPNYSHHMKWKRYGNTYWCTTVSVKGPIAALDTPKGPEPMTLTVYETLHDKHDPDGFSAVQGVSVLLLDYLLLTAMLLVTDLQEWMLMPKLDGQNASLPDLSGLGPSSAPDVPFRSDPKLRKFMYGEPIFPKLSGEGQPRLSERSTSRSPITPGLPRTPTTPEPMMATFMYPDSAMSSPHPSSPKTTLPSMTDSEDDDDDFDVFSLADTRPTSPVAESTHFSSASRAPSHTYIDPTYYGSESLPPVPPLPMQYAKSLNGRNFSSQPSTPVTGSFLPSHGPSLLTSQQFISRPRSSPPLELSDVDSKASRQYFDSFDHPRTSSVVRSDSIQSSTSTTSRFGRRPLPQPPPVPPITSNPHIARRIQSSSQLANYPAFPKDTPPTPRPQRSLPPTPGFIIPPTPGFIITPTTTPLSITTSPPTPMDASDSHLSATQHRRQPPITKTSQEDLANYVHSLTSPDRDLPPAPLPNTSIYDVPPPAYNTINFSRAQSHRRRPTIVDANIDPTASNSP